MSKLDQIRSYLNQEKANKLLLNAVERQDLEDIKKALDAGADINSRDEDGFTPLMNATWRPKTKQFREDSVRFLIEHGADVNAVNEYNHSAIFWACWFASVQTVRFLIKITKLFTAVG